VFQSTASIACSWLIVCVSRTAMAPRSATFVRSIRSGDRGERDDEDGDGGGHAGTRADQSSRLTCRGA
jgi:hypothetical protein